MSQSQLEQKARTLALAREDQQAQFKRKQEEIKQANQVKILDMSQYKTKQRKTYDDTFQSRRSSTEDQFKASTVGLVSASEFKKKREELEQAQKAEEDAIKKQQEKERKKKGKEREAKLKALSFNMDEEEGGEPVPTKTSTKRPHEDAEKKESSADSAAATSTSTTAAASSSTAVPAASSSDSQQPPQKKTKTDHTSTSRAAAVVSGKDPLADTSFLPDRAREAEEAALRAQLAEEWRKSQEQMKQEQIQIVYSYWDGTGHRNKVVVTKGMTIGQFLEKARKDIVNEFHELRGLGGDGLMYIKEDLIIPHHFSFYDLIVTKARGKSGPLFHFDVHDDVRMNIDANIEKDESHAGKIVTKGYYERNKTNFPASRWEVYDPTVIRDKYTIKGGEVRGAFAPK